MYTKSNLKVCLSDIGSVEGFTLGHLVIAIYNNKSHKE